MNLLLSAPKNQYCLYIFVAAMEIDIARISMLLLFIIMGFPMICIAIEPIVELNYFFEHPLLLF